MSAVEVKIEVIEIDSEVSQRRAEISGLTWYKDKLIILPQYPEIFGQKGTGFLYSLNKKNLLDYIKGEETIPLVPEKIKISPANLSEQINGFEGFEAITFIEDEVFLTIESSGDKMMGHLIKGEINDSFDEIELNLNSLKKIEPQASIGNASDETLIAIGDKLLSIYEANGENVNPKPVAHLFDKNMSLLRKIVLPNIEYRITDGIWLEKSNELVLLNYFWPGDQEAYKPANDRILYNLRENTIQKESKAVERIIFLNYSEDGITLSDKEPIQIQLMENGESRNWEGLVEIDSLGYIIATDKYPETILAFIRKSEINEKD